MGAPKMSCHLLFYKLRLCKFACSINGHKEVGWHVKKDSRGNLKPTCNYSIQTGVVWYIFIQHQTVTTGIVLDSDVQDTLLLGDETTLYTEAAYDSKENLKKQKTFWHFRTGAGKGLPQQIFINKR